jgi:hypothetical protein
MTADIVIQFEKIIESKKFMQYINRTYDLYIKYGSNSCLILL